MGSKLEISIKNNKLPDIEKPMQHRFKAQDGADSFSALEHGMGSPHKTVLLIDDDSDMREIGRKIITGAGYQYIEASSGSEGLEKILKFRPDLILLDYMMPQMSGDEVFQQLISSARYRTRSDIPVIMLTAKSEYDVDRNRLFEMGLSAFLVKPFGHRELINVIDNVFILHQVRQKNRELEQRIRRTEYKYQDLIENANDLIFTLSLKGDFIFINRRLATLTGYARENWIGRSFFDLVAAYDRKEAEKNFQETLRGSARIFEMRIICADKKTLYLNTNINPIFEKGEVIGSVGIARDITQRVKLEQEIVELKNFIESIIQSIGSGLITLDLEKRITYFNSGAEDITGYKAKSVIGKYLDEVFPREEIKQLLPDFSSNNSPLNREMEITIKSGNKIYIGFNVTPRMDNRETKVGTIITFRDISEIKQMQAEVIRMDRLASLGVLASGIAHEIRNPLAGIKTMAQTLEEEIEQNDSRREYTSRIIRQVNRLDELLRTFFSYARPRQPIRKFYRLQEIVHEVYMLLESRFSSHNIEFISEYDKNLPLVYVDFQQIQQVFFNLILNAIDAMQDGGHLQIIAKPVETIIYAVDRRKKPYLGKRNSSIFVEVKVDDTGSGITSEDLEAIFDPFFTTKPQGTGLGLSIVHRIVEEHEGEIRVKSEINKGTSFTLLLPTKE
ncbi:PAS domain S-box protein [candidate division KSB1 bacterium]|nr:PAS domain S-box protein [candidate division KSB1 bacterium]